MFLLSSPEGSLYYGPPYFLRLIPMTSSEFKPLMESLGLTPQWLADHSGFDLQTVQRWESGELPIPEDVEKMLVDFNQNIETIVAHAVEAFAEVTRDLGDESNKVILIRYRTDDDLWHFRPDTRPNPASSYSAMLWRMHQALEMRGIASVIGTMEPEDYFAWLGDQLDTEEMRANWITSKDEEPAESD